MGHIFLTTVFDTKRGSTNTTENNLGIPNVLSINNKV